MKGLQILEYGKPYHFSESLPVPTLESDDDVLIKIAVAGYCHTEVMVQRGEFDHVMKSLGRDLPIVPSHEGVGIIVAVGVNVKNFKVGDRVGALCIRNTCGKCSDCSQGTPKYCSKACFSGITVDGAAAEYMVADSKWVVPLPDALTFDAAAPLMCAGATIYMGLKVASLQPGQTVAIIGAGALGHLGVQFAKCLGIKVVCVDARQAPLDLVKSLKYSPDVTLDATQGIEAALAVFPEGVDATLMATDSVPAHEYGIKLTKKHGTFVFIGQPFDPIPIHYQHMIFRNLTIKGSMLSDPETAKEMVNLVAEKGIEVKTKSYALSDIVSLMEDYGKDNHAGKLVLRVSNDM